MDLQGLGYLSFLLVVGCGIVTNLLKKITAPRIFHTFLRFHYKPTDFLSVFAKIIPVFLTSFIHA
jgi:hypothetical protein